MNEAKKKPRTVKIILCKPLLFQENVNKSFEKAGISFCIDYL